MAKKQTVWRMLALALTFALALTGCNNDPPSPNDNGKGKGTGTGDITYTATADGNATTTSTKITFTFKKAVTDLAASNITVTDGTGSVTVGALTGSEKIWTLALTNVNTAGNVTVKIAQTGISSATKTVAVYKEVVASVGEDPVGGMTTYIGGEKYEFNATAKTYTISTPKDNGDETYVLDSNGKYQWEKNEIGTYIWNNTTQTLTLTPTKVGGMDKAESRAYYQDVIDEMIASLVAGGENEDGEEVPGMTQEDAEQYLISLFFFFSGVSTIDEYIDIEVNRVFADKPYNYSFSIGGEALFLYKALPDPKGTDELVGKTYYGGYPVWDDETGEYKRDEQGNYVYEKDTNVVYQFDVNRTYTFTYYDDTETGTYSYDSTSKQVWLRPATEQTPAQYYAELEENGDWGDGNNRYPSKAASWMAETNWQFGDNIWSYPYEPKEMLILRGEY